MARSNDALQGTLDLLVLKTLAQLGTMHGFGAPRVLRLLLAGSRASYSCSTRSR